MSEKISLDSSDQNYIVLFGNVAMNFAEAWMRANIRIMYW